MCTLFVCRSYVYCIIYMYLYNICWLFNTFICIYILLLLEAAAAAAASYKYRQFHNSKHLLYGVCILLYVHIYTSNNNNSHIVHIHLIFLACTSRVLCQVAGGGARVIIQYVCVCVLYFILHVHIDQGQHFFFQFFFYYVVIYSIFHQIYMKYHLQNEFILMRKRQNIWMRFIFNIYIKIQ